MGKNILWQNLSPAQIRQMIREWPVSGEQDQIKDQPPARSKVAVKVTQKAKLPAMDAKVSEPQVKGLKGTPSARRQKHVGTDGEVKFVPHRELWVGFIDGRAAVKARTEDACKALLNKRMGIEAPVAQS